MQGKAPNEIRAILTEILDCFFRGRTKELPTPLHAATSPPIKLHTQVP